MEIESEDSRDEADDGDLDGFVVADDSEETRPKKKGNKNKNKMYSSSDEDFSMDMEENKPKKAKKGKILSKINEEDPEM